MLGAPILDTGLVVVSRRILERRSVFSPDRNHLYHRLLAYGFNHRTVVIVIYAITAIFASIGVLMLPAEGESRGGLLVGGLLLMLSMFVCLHRGRLWKILKALKYNWNIAHEASRERRSFENAQVKMRESESLRAWWDTVCEMCKEMHFHSIGLWNHYDGKYINTCIWKAPGEKSTGKTVKLILPVHGNGAAEREIRAKIWAGGHLEPSGRQAMLLARLMDDFPPPEQEKQVQPPDQPADTKHRFTIKEEASSCLTGMAMQTQVDTESLHCPRRRPGKRWRVQEVLIHLFTRVIGRKAANLTSSDESFEG